MIVKVIGKLENNRILEIGIIAARRASWVIVVAGGCMQEDGLLYAISRGGAVLQSIMFLTFYTFLIFMFEYCYCIDIVL